MQTLTIHYPLYIITPAPHLTLHRYCMPFISNEFENPVEWTVPLVFSSRISPL